MRSCSIHVPGQYHSWQYIGIRYEVGARLSVLWFCSEEIKKTTDTMSIYVQYSHKLFLQCKQYVHCIVIVRYFLPSELEQQLIYAIPQTCLELLPMVGARGVR